MNFIINFSSNKHKNHVYNVCLIIVNKYTKMILYIFVTKKINVVDLIEILFEKIVLMFETSTDIVFDRKSIFTNAYWSIICFHLKTKRRFSIVFHFQINEQIERQNQTLKHYFRMYCCDEQNNWIHLLFLIQFVYQNSIYSVLKCSFFFVIYEYNFDLRYNVENNIAQKKMSAAKKQIKHVYNVRKTWTKR